MNIKAIVFKTPVLKETRNFFEHVLQLSLTETSARHFVFYAKDIRLVFIESAEDFGIEIYAEGAGENKIDIKTLKDPNNINVVIKNN